MIKWTWTEGKVGNEQEDQGTTLFQQVSTLDRRGPEYLDGIIEMGMAAQLSPLPSDPQSTRTEQSPSEKD